MLDNVSTGPAQLPLLCCWLSKAEQACYLDYDTLITELAWYKAALQSNLTFKV